MRVIAGSLKGRRLLAPTWDGLRPTSDRLRETLFNVLAARVGGARVLDGFAGTGAVGIEALSRGAAHVTFIEKDPSAGRVLQANLHRCRRVGSPEVHVSATRVESYLRRGRRPHPFDIVLADPPYAETVDMIHLLALAPAETFAPRALLILEHAKKMVIPPTMSVFHLVRRYEYGDTALSLFQRPEEPAVSL